eukprot:gene16339-17976_t
MLEDPLVKSSLEPFKALNNIEDLDTLAEKIDSSTTKCGLVRLMNRQNYFPLAKDFENAKRKATMAIRKMHRFFPDMQKDPIVISENPTETGFAATSTENHPPKDIKITCKIVLSPKLFNFKPTTQATLPRASNADHDEHTHGHRVTTI